MITIGGYTNEDFNADYIHWAVTPPEPKKEIVEVPLRDGYIDISYYIDNILVAYGPRTITIGLELRGLRSDWPATYSKMMQKLHGRQVLVQRSEDPDWQWNGWAAVGPLEDHKATAGVTITVTAQPYKERLINQKIAHINSNYTKTIAVNIESGRGTVRFVADSTVIVDFNGDQYSINNDWTELNLYANYNEMDITCADPVDVYMKELSL